MVSPVYLKIEPKRMWLQKICNCYGDFKVTRSYKKKDGEHGFLKHQSVLNCWNDNLEFLDSVNHRQILPYEIIIDLDDVKSIKKVDRICDYLEDAGEEFYCFSTGSKGYHIHIIDKNLVLFSETSKKEIREKLYKQFKVPIDTQKSSSKVLIAMECNPHWKTNNEKKLTRKSKWVKQ